MSIGRLKCFGAQGIVDLVLMARSSTGVCIAFLLGVLVELSQGDEMYLRRIGFLPAFRPVAFPRHSDTYRARQVGICQKPSFWRSGPAIATRAPTPSPTRLSTSEQFCRTVRCTEKNELNLPLEFPDGLVGQHAGPESLPQLDKDNVHVWMVEEKSTNRDDEEFVQSMYSILSPQEQARYNRNLANPGAVDQAYSFLLARALLRTTLSRYCPTVEPDEWIFVTNKYGRPCVNWEMSLGFKPLNQELRALRFNLSHCSGLIVCAFAVGRDIGIDSESTSRRGRTMSVAKRFFTRDEFHALQQVPEDAQALTFFRLWTLKEAYVKARGLGIAAIGLDNFAFSGVELLQHQWPEGSVRADLSGAGDQAAEWQFVVLNLGAHHAAAVAIACPDSLMPAELTYFRTVPLCG